MDMELVKTSGFDIDFCNCLHSQCWQDRLNSCCRCCCVCQFTDAFSCDFKGECCCDDQDPNRTSDGTGSHAACCAFSKAFDKPRIGTHWNNVIRCKSKTTPIPFVKSQPKIKIKLIYSKKNVNIKSINDVFKYIKPI